MQPSEKSSQNLRAAAVILENGVEAEALEQLSAGEVPTVARENQHVPVEHHNRENAREVNSLTVRRPDSKNSGH